MNIATISAPILSILVLMNLFGCTSASTSFEATGRNAKHVVDIPTAENKQAGTHSSISPNINSQIMAGDLLDISVYRVRELNRVVRVEPDGMISLLLIGQVHAAGKTVPELEDELERIYGKEYLQNPEILVFVKEHAAGSQGGGNPNNRS